ncbi:MAG: pentapeptide repeat-containing protein [Firmicutes bacterium]|nr:pentapeptide repeat-containing protein [Bacillota bacterium]
MKIKISFGLNEILVYFLLLLSLGCTFYKFNSTDNFDFSSLCAILTAAIVALLGVAITSYIFLHTELQSRKKNNSYMKKTIDSLLVNNRKNLVFNCMLGLFALVVLITSYEFNSFSRGFLLAIMTVSYVSIARLILFDISMINHNQSLLKEALAELKKMEENKAEYFIPNNITFTSKVINNLEYSGFLKEVVDIQKIIEKLIQNHSKQIAGIPESRYLSAILLTKGVDETLTERLANQYDWLFDYRNLLLVISEILNDKDETQEVCIPDTLPKMIEDSLAQKFLSDELLTDISLSAKEFSEANFTGTSFGGSLLSSVTFNNANLSNASFENCQLTDMKVIGACPVDGVNFYRSIIQADFEERLKFLYCNFSEADFSKQRELKKLTLDFSTFRRANFIGQIGALVIVDCQMKSVVGSSAKFTNAKITGTKFDSSDFSDAEFGNAIISGCNLQRTNLAGTNFYYAIIESSNLNNARLENARFIQTKLDGIKLDSAYGNNISFRDCAISGSPSSFDNAIFTKADFSNACIETASFIGVTFTNSIFIQTTATKGTSFANCIFIGVQFSDKPNSPSGGYFDCDFSESIFDDSIIDGVRFCKCTFTNSTFKGAILKNVDFCSSVGLKPDMFDSVASIDTYTREKLSACGCVIHERQVTLQNQVSKENQAVAQVISERHSTRNFKPDVTLDKPMLESLINAARKAPSAKNRQPWKFRIINDRLKIIELADKMTEINYDGSGNILMDPNSISSLRNASAVVFVLYDKDNDKQHEMPDYQSIGACIENLIIQATAQHIDSLWMCDPLSMHDMLKSFLNLPLDFVAVVLLGKQEEVGGVSKKNLEDICIWD